MFILRIDHRLLAVNDSRWVFGFHRHHLNVSIYLLRFAIDISDSAVCLQMLRGGQWGAGFMLDRVSNFMIVEMLHDIN